MRLLILLIILFLSACQSAVVISTDSKDKKNIIQTNSSNITNNNIANNNNITNTKDENIYYVKSTSRGKLLVLKNPIFFDLHSSEVDTNKYIDTINYISSILTETNIINIYIEGHIDSSETKYMNKDIKYTLNKTNNILYLYDRYNDDLDLSYLRSLAVENTITNNNKDKIKTIGLQDLIRYDYNNSDKNRRVEFIIIENSNDMYIYSNYIYNIY